MNASDDTEQKPVSIARVVIRCPPHQENESERCPQLVVDGETVAFFKVPPRASGASAKQRTRGVFATKQPPTWQAYTLLLWLFERRGKPHERNELPLERAQKLLGWEDVGTPGTLVERLKKIIGDSQVLVYEGQHAWIRQGVDVVIDDSQEEQESVLRWAGLVAKRAPAPEPVPRGPRDPPPRRAEPPNPRGVATSVAEARARDLDALKAKVEAALRIAPALSEALAGWLSLDRGADDLPGCLSDKLFDLPARDVATAFAAMLDSLDRDQGVARNLLWQILPLAGDWRDVLAQARAAGADGRSLELRLRTETVAEIILAGVEARCCLWAPDDLMPQGAAHVQLPAAAHAPLFDPKGARLAEAVEAVFIDLYEERKPGEPRAPGHELWGRVKKRFPRYRDFKIGVTGEMEHSAERKAPHYMLIIDDDLDPEQTRDRDQTWRVAQQAIGKALPHLRLVRLTGGEDELRAEYKIVPPIRDVRDRS